MNGHELSKTALSDSTACDAQRDERGDRQEHERWASTVATCLQQAVPVRPATLGFGAPESSQQVPDGWRPSVEALTPGASGSTAAARVPGSTPDSGAVAADNTNRLQVRVKTEEFGEIAVVVERVETGLRVLLGAANPQAVMALTRDCLAVRRALESDGQSVGSLEIVRMNGLGTDLALTKMATSNRARRSQESAESASDLGQRKKKTKRLNVTG